VSYATIADLRSQLGASTKSAVDEAYAAKQLHTIPDAPVVDRRGFILDLVKGKRVLEFGASGPLHDEIMKAASAYVGVDRVDAPGVVGFDLDDVREDMLPSSDQLVDLIVCGEVLEHLSNPGWFLTRLRGHFPDVPVLITVPNAFSLAGAVFAQKGIENVNIDHVCWYSYRTVRTLLERVGYTAQLVGWYHGSARQSEGLIVLAE
jgi:hypothetical protein